MQSTLTKGERTKQKILETLSFMIWKQSYGNTSVDDIVKEAEVNKASFYRYFKNKEQASIEGIQYLASQIRKIIFDASFNEHSHPEKRLESIFQKLYEAHVSMKEKDNKVPGCPFINLGNELTTTHEQVGVEVDQIFNGFQVYFERIFKDAQASGLTQSSWQAKDLAKQVQGVLNGAMVRAKLTNQPKEILNSLKTTKVILGFSPTP